jgi:hypothetical protein
LRSSWDFLPWKTFHRIVDRYDGNYRIRTLPCAEHFRILAFAQLTCRESLRDIEACLAAQAAKLYHMGIRSPVRRATLADANERRDWRIYAEFAQRLIAQARRLYASEDLGLELSNTVYALDDRRRSANAKVIGIRFAPASRLKDYSGLCGNSLTPTNVPGLLLTCLYRGPVQLVCLFDIFVHT